MSTRTSLVLAAIGIKIVTTRDSRAWCTCPFHVNTDAKWEREFFIRLSGERAGNYHCFACKASGNLTALVMHVRDLDAKDAKAFIRDAGIGWRAPKAKVRFVAREPLLARPGFTLPKSIIFGPLAEWDTIPQSYARKRGITDLEVERYGLGFACDGRLAHRIVFPVRVGAAARAVSYSARTFVGEEPRYMTPHTDEDADEDAIFGEHLWPPVAVRKLPGSDVVAITEGAIDSLAVTRVTGLPAGSISGSNVLPAHVIALATFARVVILTDPDAAGDKAAASLRISLGRNARSVRALLPPQRDAAVLALTDPGRLKHEIDRALATTR